MTVDEIQAEHDDAMLELATRGSTNPTAYERLVQEQTDRTRSRLDGLIGGTQREYDTLTQTVDLLDADPSEVLTDAQLTEAATLRPGLDTLSTELLVSRSSAVADPVTAYAYLQALTARVETKATGTLESGPQGHYHKHTPSVDRQPALDAIQRLASVVKGTSDQANPRPRLRELGRARRDAMQAVSRLSTTKAVQDHKASGHYGYYRI
jgi:hypothetical protein